METEAFNVRLTTEIEDGSLQWDIEEMTGGSLNRYYVEVWTRGGAHVDEDTFHEYALVENTFESTPLSVNVETARDSNKRPAISIVVFENTGSGTGGKELYRHEYRFFQSCGRWHYIDTTQ